MQRAEAKKLRMMIERGAEELPDEDALKAPILSEHWKSGQHYPIGKRLYYNGKLYSVLIEHDSHDAYRPDVTVSLYAEVLIPDPGEIPEWVQPGSTNPYMKGDKVRHIGKIWQSAIDYNVYEPGSLGTETLWVEVAE